MYVLFYIWTMTCLFQTYNFPVRIVLLVWKVALGSGNVLRMSSDSEDLCPLELCWDFYQTAQETLDFYDDAFPSLSFDASEQYTLDASGDVWNQRCSILRSFFSCLRNHSRICLGNLNYHSAQKGVEKEMKHLKCSPDGAVYRPGVLASPPRGPPYHTICSYEGNPEMRYCAVYGDPHVRSFDGIQEGCRVKGAWPLVDNQHFTVQTTQETVVDEDFTAVTKVTVIAKADSECGDSRYTSYHASGGNLPTTFEDGRSEIGDLSTIYIHQVSVDHIEIHFDHIATTIVLRTLASLYSVAIATPVDVITPPKVHMATPIQLCVTRCSSEERINHQKMEKLMVKTGRRWQHQEALDRCRMAGLTSTYLESCVFDVVVMDDLDAGNFSIYAQQDFERLTTRKRQNNFDLSSGGALDHLAEGMRAVRGRATRLGFNRATTILMIVVVVVDIIINDRWSLSHRMTLKAVLDLCKDQ